MPKVSFFKAPNRQCYCKATKLLLIVTSQSCYQYPPLRSPQNSKAAPGSCLKAVPRRCSPKLCPAKLFSEAVAPKLRFCKPVYENGSRKLFCKAAPKSCSPKLPSCFGKLVQAAPQRGSPQQAPPQSGCLRAAMLQTCSPKL